MSEQERAESIVMMVSAQTAVVLGVTVFTRDEIFRWIVTALVLAVTACLEADRCREQDWADTVSGYHRPALGEGIDIPHRPMED